MREGDPTQGEGERQPQDWPSAGEWLKGAYLSQSDGLSKLAILGAPLNASISPGRVDLAPNAIRNALGKFVGFDIPHNNDLRIVKIHDAGDLDLARTEVDAATPIISKAVRDLRDKNMPVILLGGDNSITRGGADGLPCAMSRCGLVCLDAHLGLHSLDCGLHNANPVRALLQDGVLGQNVVIIGVQSFVNSPSALDFARENGIRFVPVEQVIADGVDRTMRTAFEQLRDLDSIYFSLDMDVLDRAYAPACPGSRPGGLAPWQVRQIAYMCGTHYNIAAMDIVEVDPEQDVADTTVQCAAACILSFASGLLERRERK